MSETQIHVWMLVGDSSFQQVPIYAGCASPDQLVDGGLNADVLEDLGKRVLGMGVEGDDVMVTLLQGGPKGTEPPDWRTAPELGEVYLGYRHDVSYTDPATGQMHTHDCRYG